MSDNTERIVVEVDGQNASEGFGRIKTAAQAADQAIDSVGRTADRAGASLGGLGGSAQRSADGMKDAGSASDSAKQGIRGIGEEADRAKSKFDQLQQSLFGGARGKVVWLWDLASDGLRSAMGFAEAFIEKIANVQRTISLLNNIPGANVGSEFEYLIGVANKYGLALNELQTNYARFILSTQNSSMTNEQAKRTFEQVAMAVRTLHMNAQQATFTFLALEEMMSKGKLSMQQLNRQFSIRIPGAMAAIAREIGVTTPVLVEFITKVGAASDKMMPIIGNALQRLFQNGLPNSMQALDAELERIKNSVTVFFKEVLDSGGTEGMSRLLKTIQGLLQTDTIAASFSRAMNMITNSIADFLGQLKPGDIEKFADKALVFLEAFARLAIMAGNAVIFMSQHIPAFAAAFGAFMGATALAPLGPWGAAVGLVAGAVGGYAVGMKLDSGGFGVNSSTAMSAQSDQNDQRIATLEAKIKRMDSLPSIMQPDSVKNDRAELAALKSQNVAIMMAMNDQFNSQYQPGETSNDTTLGAPSKMLTGNVMDQLKKLYGANGGDDKLIKRQQSFMESLLAKVQAVETPDEDRFATILAQAKKLGIGDNYSISDADGNKRTLGALVDVLQADFNKRQQDASDKKTGAIERQYKDMEISLGADISKFQEKYNVSNLLEVDESAWQNKAQKMSSLLNRELDQLAADWQKRAENNPLFKFAHPDIDGEIANLRKMGDAYINEYKRIEQEKRSALGGEKQFLKEWNENATNFGQMTADFLRGVSGNVVDMLTNMVMTGKISFAKLTEFVLSYIVKLLLVQALTPFINAFSGALTNAFSSIMSIGSDLGSSMYSLSNGSSGLGMKLPGRATGGSVWPGQQFVVGERGPEVVTFDRPGYVHPNDSLGSGGGDNINIQINVDAKGDTSTNGSNKASDLGRRLSDSVRAIIVDEKRPGGLLA